jgi:N-acetylglucosamine-6-phosphate deacetylase
MGLFLKNVKIATQQEPIPVDILLHEHRIKEIGGDIQRSSSDSLLECTGKVCLPGFIDLHIHGSYGVNLMQADPEKVLQLANELASQGITGFLATTAGESIQAITKNCRAIVDAITQQTQGARILGIHVEGPFFNTTSPARGANNPAWLRVPDVEEAKEIVHACQGHLRLFDIAPELPGAKDVIEFMVSENVIVSAAHSDATYEQAKQGFDWGITHLTHTYNGMRRIHHREPGIAVAALLDERVWLEVIADGQHVHPQMIDLIYQLKGLYGMGAVTDATTLAGLPPGEYDFIGTQVIVEREKAYLKEAGTLAGSIATGMDMFVNLCEWGFSQREAAIICSSSPAQHMGWDQMGEVRVGNVADMVLLSDSGLDLTIIDGEIAYQASTFSG